MNANTIPAGSMQTDEATRNFWAALRWSGFVTAFLIAQLILAYVAVTCASIDGGEQPIAGADEAIARSYEK